MAIGSNTSFST